MSASNCNRRILRANRVGGERADDQRTIEDRQSRRLAERERRALRRELDSGAVARQAIGTARRPGQHRGLDRRTGRGPVQVAAQVSHRELAAGVFDLETEQPRIGADQRAVTNAGAACDAAARVERAEVRCGERDLRVGRVGLRQAQVAQFDVCLAQQQGRLQRYRRGRPEVAEVALRRGHVEQLDDVVAPLTAGAQHQRVQAEVQQCGAEQRLAGVAVQRDAERALAALRVRPGGQGRGDVLADDGAGLVAKVQTGDRDGRHALFDARAAAHLYRGAHAALDGHVRGHAGLRTEPVAQRGQGRILQAGVATPATRVLAHRELQRDGVAQLPASARRQGAGFEVPAQRRSDRKRRQQRAFRGAGQCRRRAAEFGFIETGIRAAQRQRAPAAQRPAEIDAAQPELAAQRAVGLSARQIEPQCRAFEPHAGDADAARLQFDGIDGAGPRRARQTQGPRQQQRRARREMAGAGGGWHACHGVPHVHSL
jgi:hypothetical protein